MERTFLDFILEYSAVRLLHPMLDVVYFPTDTGADHPDSFKPYSSLPSLLMVFNFRSLLSFFHRNWDF
jgi:hypothetical protein